MLKHLILLFCGALFSTAVWAKTVDITLLHVNDVYEIEASNGGKLGGLARVSGLLKQLKKQNPHTFSILSGDYLSPSAVGTAVYEGKPIQGAQMVDVFNAMHWDYMTLGNHEFDNGYESLQARLKASKFTVFSANVLDNQDHPGQLLANTQRSVVFTVDGIKVGLVGVVLDGLSKDFVKISDPMATAKAEVKRLRHEEKVDILIMVSHQSLDEDIRFAEEISGIDLIAGGHEHQNMYFLRGPNQTPIAKADANARTAYIHKLSFDTASKQLSIDSDIQIIDAHIAEDPKIAQRVEWWMEKAYAAYRAEGYRPKQTLATIDITLDGLEGRVRNGQTELTKLVAQSALHAFAGAEISLLNAGSIRIDDILPPGNVDQYDGLRILPFGGDYSLVSMPGSILQQALEAGQGNKGSGGFLHYANIRQDNNGQWLIKDTPLEADQRYKLSIASYLIEYGDINLEFLVNNPQITLLSDTKADARKALFAQFERQFPK